MKSVALLLLVAIALLGCEEEIPVEKPPPPDMSALAAAYDNPTATISAETMPDIAQALSQYIGINGLLCGWQDVSDMACDGDGCMPCDGLQVLLDLLERLEEVQQTEQSELIVEGDLAQTQQPLVIGGVNIAGEGFMRVRYICPGWGQQPVADEAANGRLELIIGFTDAGFDPVMWGTFFACRARFSGSDFYVDGALSASTGKTFFFEDMDDLTFLVEIVGDVRMDGQTHVGTIDMRLSTTGEAELRLPVGDENAIFFARSNVYGFRAANGEWTCDMAQLTCRDQAGSTVSWQE